MAESRKFAIAVDSSEASAYAFTWAITNLAKSGDKALVLTCQVSSSAATLPTVDIAAGGEYAVPIVVPLDTEALARESSEAVALIDKFMRQCQQHNIESEGEVVKGEPGPMIVEKAKSAGVDAIIIGNHGKGLIERTFLGSIGDYVLHHAPGTVVIVRTSKDSSAHDPLLSTGLSRKIVVAVDDSKEATYALEWALKNVVTEKDIIVILHVQRPIAPFTATGGDQFGVEEVYVPPDTSNREDVQQLDASEKLVEKFMVLAAAETKVRCEGKVVTGPTGEKLMRELQSLQADLVVLGTRGQGLVSRTFLGSVSTYLAHHSPCPVVVAKVEKLAQAEPSEDLHEG